jgi:hypothetical protein
VEPNLTLATSVPLFLKVECHAGYKADQHPLRFSFVISTAKPDLILDNPVSLGERTHQVTEVLDHWYGPDYECFKVGADDGNLYVLRHHLGEDAWSLDAFRRDHPSLSQAAYSPGRWMR